MLRWSVPPELVKYYQTVNEKETSEFTSHQQTEIRLITFRTDRKDMYFEKKKTLKNIIQKNKKSKVLMSKFFLILLFNDFILKRFIGL